MNENYAKKEKKGLKIFIIILLILLVGILMFILGQYASNKMDINMFKDGTNTKVEESSLEEPKKLPKDEEIDGKRIKISKKYSNPNKDELVYTYLTVTVEDKVNEGSYTYKIPQINIDSRDVEKINKEILQKYDDIIKRINENQEIDFGCEDLSYKYYESNGILSLVMISRSESEGYFFCKTYNIDTSTKEEMTNNELLEKMNISETDLEDKTLKGIDDLEMYKNYIQGDSENKKFVEEQKQNTKYEYVHNLINKITLYVNNEKHLCAYLEVNSIAGGPRTTIILDLEKNKVIELNEFYK